MADVSITQESNQRAMFTHALFQLGGAVGSFVWADSRPRFCPSGFWRTPIFGWRLRIFSLGPREIRRLLACAILRPMRVIGGQGSAKCLARLFYPTRIRATVWVGRWGSQSGSIIGPLVEECFCLSNRIPAASSGPRPFHSNRLCRGFLCEPRRASPASRTIVKIRARYNNPSL